jgi:hypothetical protein
MINHRIAIRDDARYSHDSSGMYRSGRQQSYHGSVQLQQHISNRGPLGSEGGTHE